MKRKEWMPLMAAVGALAGSPLLLAQMQQEPMEQDQQIQREQMQGQTQEQQRTPQQKPWADQQASLDAVRDLQQQLKDQGYYQDGNVDGLVGPKTESALREFQQAQGLETTGEINAETLSALGIDRSEFAAFGIEEQEVQQQELQSQPPGGAEQEMQQQQMQQPEGTQQEEMTIE